MKKNKINYWENQSITNSGILSFFEKIIRSHPLLYLIGRKIVRYTNIFEEDAEGVKIIKFKKKVNILDIGASDGIASNFFLKNLDVNKIICFEPDKNYVRILRNINSKGKIKVKPFAIGDKNKTETVYYPEYQFLGKKFRFVTYCYYDKSALEKQIILDFIFRKNIFISKDKLKIQKYEKIKKKIDLIKIDVNGFEFSVIKGLSKLIKRDKPALLIEMGKETYKIEKFLKKYSYDQFIFSNKHKVFKKVKKKYALNIYFLQKKNFI